MRKPKHSSEPSIEEILASIRNIIADEGVSSKSPVPANEHEPLRRSTQDFENAIFEDGGELLAKSSGASVAGDKFASNTADTGDEILELTEDFMLALPSGDQPATAPRPVGRDNPSNELDAKAASRDFRPVPSREEEELDEVLSNLAAEVERLAAPDAVQHLRSRPDAPAELPGRDTIEDLQSDTPSAEAKSFGAPEFAEPEEQSVGQPQIAGMAEPMPTPSASPQLASQTRQPQPSASKSKPVWSARRLENPASPAPKTETVDSQEQPAPPETPVPQQASPSRSSPVSRRDLWAEGVQMPVPDTGPELPLPMAEDDTETVSDQNAAANRDKPTSEPDRKAVGSFLTRVFGSTPAAEPEETPADETKLRAKAEKLARDTISDFAEAKLNAPSVGHALKADKEFMDEVVSSLENALSASDDEADDDLSENARLPDFASDDAAPPDMHDEGSDASGLELKLKEALAADAKASRPANAQQIDEEAAMSAGLAETVSANIASDELVEPAPAETAKAEPVASEEIAERPPEVAATPPVQSTGHAAAPAPALNLPSSLEGSIKEMIKPLLIQWLNDNLPRIVEDAVREELSGRSEMTDVRNRSAG